MPSAGLCGCYCVSVRDSTHTRQSICLSLSTDCCYFSVGKEGISPECVLRRKCQTATFEKQKLTFGLRLTGRRGHTPVAFFQQYAISGTLSSTSSSPLYIIGRMITLSVQHI